MDPTIQLHAKPTPTPNSVTLQAGPLIHSQPSSSIWQKPPPSFDPFNRPRQHKDAYKVALEDESPNEASRAFVQALDKVYYSASFYFKPRSPDELEHLMSFVKLWRLELRANYGDYLGHEASLFRADTKKTATGAHS